MYTKWEKMSEAYLKHTATDYFVSFESRDNEICFSAETG